MLQVDISIENEERFNAALARAREVVSDLRIPLTLISKDFFKSQQAIWQLQGPGQYEDLSPAYKERKQKRWGFVYPILKASGRLEKSMTDPTSPDAVSEIINGDTLLLGTRVPYGVYHQSREPRKRLPRRPFLFIGPEASQYATSEMMGRPERWLNYINSYVLRKLGADIGPVKGDA